MKYINRRDVLKGLGAFSTVAAVNSITAQTDRAGKGGAASARTASPCATMFPRLNIVLHGMHVLVFDQTSRRLTILLPNVPGHVFAAGNFGSELPLDPSTTPYNLTNTPGGTYGGPAVGATDKVVVGWSSGTRYGEDPYCAFDLPWPDCLVHLRTYFLPMNVPLFLPGTTSTANKLDHVTSVPMINVLSYKLTSPNALLAGVKLKFDNAQIAHAHIIGEPAFGSMAGSSMHPNRAFSILNVLFDAPLDLRINPAVDTGVLSAASSGEPGVSNLEVSSNAELRFHGANCGTGLSVEGGHPRNCMQVFVIKP